MQYRNFISLFHNLLISNITYVLLHRIVLFKRNVIPYLISYEYKSFFNFLFFKLVKIFHMFLFHRIFQLYIPIAVFLSLFGTFESSESLIVSLLENSSERKKGMIENGNYDKSSIKVFGRRGIEIENVVRLWTTVFTVAIRAWRVARGAWRVARHLLRNSSFESGAPRGANLVRRERDQAGPNHFVVRAPMPDLSYCF